ncbi:MAG: hypothetical protein GX958_12360 [Desulfitobacterium sp.]|nr:hypothetical protein [Desulfitobacterium sp.]
MPFHENVRDYIEKICNQIRWKKIRPVIAKELKNHIDDQIQSYVSSGMEFDEATEKALIEMGDPLEIGLAFDRTHRPQPEWSMLIIMAIALFIGLVLRIFLSPVNEFGHSLLPDSLLAIAIGVVLMTAAYFFDFSIIGSYPRLTQALIVFPALILFILSTHNNNALRYLHYVVLLLPIAYAAFLYTQKNKDNLGIGLGLIIAFVFSSIPFAGWLLPETLLVFLSCLIMLNTAIAKDWFCSRTALKFMFVNILALAGSTIVAIIFTNIEGVTRRLGLENYELSNLIKTILLDSKLFGQGESMLFNTLPFSYDERYLLVYLTHRFGWIVSIGIVTLLAAFVIRGFHVNFKQTNMLGLFISTAILLTITFQIIIYIISNMGFPFFSAITLPFVSYGKTVTVVNMALFGLMLSVFKTRVLRFNNPYDPTNSLSEKITPLK